MKITLKTEKQFEAKYLLAEVGVRYWEDASVNGIDDENGDLIPCRDGDLWKPLIELESGKIINWENGKYASIHYKSCDNNVFKLLDAEKNVIIEIEDYVIKMMCPKREGYGDYVIMDINSNGFIENFKWDLSEFV